ncbi:MAG: hypothetical protein LBK28_08250 [Propionibacteriaceae bacterium]|nr:hypothetical protein [Propionibacteriaceae bacterium]
MASILTIGIFIIPIAVVLTLIGALVRAIDSASVPGAIIGVGMVPLYLAWLNRGGPGEVCESTELTIRCSEHWNPWLFLAVTIVLIGLGGWLVWRNSPSVVRARSQLRD